LADDICLPLTFVYMKAAYIAAFRRIAPLLHERGWSVLVLAADEVKSNLDQLTSLDLIISDASMYGKIRKVQTPACRRIFFPARATYILR
jgi:hypothetical protein